MRWNKAKGKGQRAWGIGQKIFCFSLCAVLSALCVGTAWGDCSVTVTQARFGSYDSLGSAPLDTVAEISVTCSPGVAYNIKSDPGQHAVADFDRRMRSSAGDSTLNYNFYRDSARTEVWGDGTGSTLTLSATGTGGPVQHRVYGRIPGRQNVKADSYRDSISVTVEW